VKRVFDLVMGTFFLIVLAIPMIIIAAAIRLTSKGPALYWSNRKGKKNVHFMMPKFRTMKVNTPAVATHLFENPDIFLTPIGSFLRRTSLDEIPQLFSIVQGKMSFVGPRPALFNQEDLVALRTEKGVDQIVPGLTGWAQVNGRDEIPIQVKVELDVEYKEQQTFWFDMKILWMTFINAIK
ncbi:uncharacterized protein METZ01_LOCUS482842, partial [marine metagenome]